MKDKYIKPEIEIVEMECGQILAASGGEPETEDVGLSNKRFDDVFGAKQHSFNVWGDEEEQP